MIHPWIFGGSLLAGGGLVAFALNTRPSDVPVPSLEPSPTSVEVVSPEPAPVIAEPASSVIEMPEARIAAPVRTVRARHVTSVTPVVDAPPLQPCSAWRELGPTTVNRGKAAEAVSVRTLCP